MGQDRASVWFAAHHDSEAASGPLPGNFIQWEVQRPSAPLTIDGDLHDWGVWPWRRLVRDNAAYINVRPPGAPPPDPSDASVSFKAMWSPLALYFALYVQDDRIWNDSPEVWNDDEVELAFDGLRNGMNYSADDHQYTVNPNGRSTDFGLDPQNPPGIIAASACGISQELRLLTWTATARSP